MKVLLKKIYGRIYRTILLCLKFLFVKPIIYFPNVKRENLSKKVLELKNPHIYEYTEKIFKLLQNRRFTFRGWSLAKSSIRYTLLELFSVRRDRINIVELGGGVSSFFWYYLKKELKDVDFKITTFEHDKDWSEFLNKEIGSDINILYCKLKQLTDGERINLFEYPKEAISFWQKLNDFLPEEKYKTTKVRNTFYDIPMNFLHDDEKIDLLIVDGPHGNGRSMSFPLFQKRINSGTIILLDDYNHYPFVEDLNKIFQIKILAFEDSYSKKWILLKVY